jgi:DNA-binding phage protein
VSDAARESEESTISRQILKLKSRVFVASLLRPVLERSEGMTKCCCRVKLKREGFYRNSLTESIGISDYLRPRLEVLYFESENWGKVSEV